MHLFGGGGDDSRRPYNLQFSIQEGLVGDNVDPVSIGRIKIEFPGVDGMSDWALPAFVLGGGSDNRGIWSVPAVGSSVVAFFANGDPNTGIFYAPGWWARDGEFNETPAVIQEAVDEDGPEAATLIESWTSGSFAYVMDRRAGKERIYLRSERFNTDPNAKDSLLIELDAASGQMTLNAIGGVHIRTHGQFTVDASAGAVINGRTVGRGTRKAL